MVLSKTIVNSLRLLVVYALLLLGLVPTAWGEEHPAVRREYQIAARYAPEFYQVVDLRRPRLDYLTRFDFDGNWRADDNWSHVTRPDQPLPAYVYFAVAETRTHFFIHYVCFHPRDWKGNWLTNGSFQFLKFLARPLVFPRWLGLDVLSLAHENDLEGVLVVVARRDPDSLEGRTALVEAFSHHRFRTFHSYGQEEAFGVKGNRFVRTLDERPLLFIESSGHGVRERLRAKKNQVLLHYRYTGTGEEPAGDFARPVGYELLSLHGTLWQHALEGKRAERTFSRFRLYDQFELADFFQDNSPRIGTALRGRKRGRNRAVAPWGWKNNGIRGQWFFDPARNIAERHHPRSPFDTEYLLNRFLAAGVAARRIRPNELRSEPLGASLEQP